VDGGRLYNCAVVVSRGEVLGVVPKIYLPNYREFYERRWFTSGADVYGREINVAGRIVPFGRDLLFKAAGPAGFTFHVEICEDFWVATPPSTLGRARGRGGAAEPLGQQCGRWARSTTGDARAPPSPSGRPAAYAYSASGPARAPPTWPWDGHAAIYEVGSCLTETKRFMPDSTLCYADVDLGRIRQERLRTGSIADAQAEHVALRALQTIEFTTIRRRASWSWRAAWSASLMCPSDPAKLDEHCWEAYHIQVQGLAERLKATVCRPW
jgi:NAD+ synthase (glutamine-hydrolysing)